MEWLDTLPLCIARPIATISTGCFHHSLPLLACAVLQRHMSQNPARWLGVEGRSLDNDSVAQSSRFCLVSSAAEWRALPLKSTGHGGGRGVKPHSDIRRFPCAQAR